jgi:hypothetical protein
MSSLKAFLTTCEHVDDVDLVKKYRVFVTGDMTFFAMLQGKGTRRSWTK